MNMRRNLKLYGLNLVERPWKRALALQNQIGAKKKIDSRFGQLEIHKSHAWSECLSGFQMTPYLQELQVYGGQADNYEASVRQMEKYLRIELNSSQMERVTKYYATEISDEMDELSEVHLSKAKDLREALKEQGNAYCMLDGSMIQTREGETSNDWKEVKLGRIFTDKDNYELDKHHHWISDSIYSAHLGEYQGFLAKFEPMVDFLDGLNERLVFVADGAPWIWRWIEETYAKATQILDFYHGMEHLAKFAKLYFKSKEAQKKWLDTQKMQLLNDRVGTVIERIKDMTNGSKKAKEERERLLTYLENNKSRMLYKTFLDRGLAIGSGAIESAHRTVIQKRLKQSGQRWTIDGAQKIVNLRVVNENKQWNRVIDIIKVNEIATFLRRKTA